MLTHTTLIVITVNRRSEYWIVTIPSRPAPFRNELGVVAEAPSVVSAG
jgi:hypothetical protein